MERSERRILDHAETTTTTLTSGGDGPKEDPEPPEHANKQQQPQQEEDATWFCGFIVRRRCMGRSLAFADLQLLSAVPPSVSSSTSDPATTTTAIVDSKKRESETTHTMISVMFRRQSVRTQEFPTKKAALPFGAQLQVLCCRPGPPEETTTTHHKNHHPDSNSSCNNTQWTVLEWKLLTNPRQEALELATKLKEGLQAEEGGGGISSSIYLQSRHEAHQAVSERMGCNFNQVKSNKKKKLNNVPTNNANNDKETVAPSVPAPNGLLPQSTSQTITENNPAETEGGHGGGGAQTYRVFAEWIVANLLRLDGTDRVLDVAGGKGKLSLQLAALAGIPCTVLDPVQRKPPRSSFKRLIKQGKPVPDYLHGYFLAPHDDETKKNPNATSDGTPSASVLSSLSSSSLQSSSPHKLDQQLRQHMERTQTLVQQHTCIVGLHADQCTQDIWTVALQQQQQVSVAIVPCCVFPDLFATRRRTNGTVVRSYHDFCEYLLETGHRLLLQHPQELSPKNETGHGIQTTTLGFPGKNKCLYYKAPSSPSPADPQT